MSLPRFLEILDRAHKRITLEKSRRAVELSKEAGISPFGSFILGLPGETRETMEETYAFAQSLRIPFGFHLLSPFPGTKIRERASEYGIKILTDDWSLYDADHAVTETEGISAEEVESFAKSFFGRLGAEIEEMKRGTVAGTYRGPYREEMEKRVEVDFVWKLLAGDLVEEHGVIPRAEVSVTGERERPLQLFAQRLASIVSLPLPLVESKLRKLSDRGLILCHPKGLDSKFQRATFTCERQSVLSQNEQLQEYSHTCPFFINYHSFGDLNDINLQICLIHETFAPLKNILFCFSNDTKY